jgi:hypothetical protein
MRSWCDSCISDSSLTSCGASRARFYNFPLRFVFPGRFSYILTFCRMRSSFPFPWLLCRRKSIGLSSVRVHCGLTLSYTDCRSVGQNLDILRSLTQAATTKAGKPLVGKANLNNMLMQLRKSVHRRSAASTWYSFLRRCLQHPYLNSEDIEPRNLTPAEAHERLIGASTKLRFLKMLLPKLKARGHRILLFSQVSGYCPVVYPDNLCSTVCYGA